MPNLPKYYRVLIAGLILCFAGQTWTEPVVRPNQQQLHGRSVYVIPIDGAIDKTLLFVIRRAFAEIRRQQPVAVILDLDTPGGGLRETEEIIAHIRALQIPIYAYVNPHALSAGAIISLGCNGIFMAPGSRIGSAMPILINQMSGGAEGLPAEYREKILSDVRSLVRGLAQENNYNQDLAMAMVDPEVEVRIGERVIVAEGELLNLTAQEAVEIIEPQTEPLLATAVVADIDALLAHLNIENVQVVRIERHTAERIASYITMLGPLLMALGLLGIYTEFQTPGFGLPGMAGLTLLGLFFFGHYIAGLAGMEEMVLVAIGIILLALEIFVIPGFGVAGILGITCIFSGLLLGLIPRLPSPSEALPGMPMLDWQNYFQEALLKMVIAVSITVIAGFFLRRYLPKTTMFNRLVLQTSLASGRGDAVTSVEHPTAASQWLHQQGVALTQLRPCGTAVVGNARLDVVTSGDLIAKGTPIKVVKVEGARIVVEAVASDTSAQP